MEEFDNLNARQKEAVLSVEEKVCVIAGPGCGKTKTLVSRVVYLVKKKNIKPQTILLLTFSKKAIKEIKERISKQLGKAYTFKLNIHNFHSFCYKVLHEKSSLFGFRENFPVYDRNDQEVLVKRILRENSQVLIGRDFSDLMNNISLCKIRAGHVKFLEKNNHEDFLIYKSYESSLRKEGALDFNDLLLYILNGLRKSEIRKEIARGFTNILVDEFQDVNDIQWEIVNLLANEEARIFLVGDPNQSIYGFQGSSPSLISSLIEKDSWKKFFLNVNYRSTKNIVKLSNLFLEKNNDSLVLNQLETDNGKGVPVEIIRNCSPRFIVRKILYLIDNQNIKLNSIALIYRSNYLSSFIEQELVSNGIPYEILGSFKFIEREEIKDILAYLKLITFQNDTSFLRIIKGITGVGSKLVENIEVFSKKENLNIFSYLNKELLGKEEDKLQNLKLNKIQREGLLNIISSLNHSIKKLEEKNNLWKFVNDSLQKFDYFEKLQQKTDPIRRKKNVQQLLNFIETWEKERIGDENSSLRNLLNDFLQHCSIVFEDSNLRSERNNLVLSSIHQVKGLEFDFVFFLYLDHNILPHRISTDLAEEKRIFYVGITRARKSLYLVSNGNIPSIFLDLLTREN